MRTTRAATGSARPSTCRRAAWPTRTSTTSSGAHRGFELDARQVDDLDQPRVERHALARLHQALRHQAGDRRARARRRAPPCARARRRPARPAAWPAAPAALLTEVSSAGRRDEALVDQRLVVVERALRRCRAAPAPTAACLLGLAQPPARTRWRRAGRSPGRPCTRSPSRTVSDLHLGRHLGLDEGAVDRLQAARDRRACAPVRRARHAPRRRARVRQPARRWLRRAAAARSRLARTAARPPRRRRPAARSRRPAI